MSSNPLPADFASAFTAARGRLDPFRPACFFPSIGSTNDAAMNLAADGGAEGLVVIADQQTGGRGRRGRTWFSPPGVGLYLSAVVAPARARVDSDRAVALLTLAAGVAIAEGVEAATGFRADLKWPNDLYAGRLKFGGILAEAAHAESGAPPFVVVGYGLNVRRASYPPELVDRATSIEAESGLEIDRAALCIETLAALSRRYADLLDGRFDVILDAWRARAPASRGAHVTWQSPAGPRSGVTAGIDDRGALLVRTENRIERIVAGEVFWHQPAAE